MFNFRWYFPNCSRQTAEKQLVFGQQISGTFLVHNSQNDGKGIIIYSNMFSCIKWSPCFTVKIIIFCQFCSTKTKSKWSNIIRYSKKVKLVFT